MEIIKEFGINPILLLAQIVNFTILLFLLKKFLYQPILKVLAERREKIANSLKDAEEIEKRLAKISSEQAEILDKAKKEAAALITESKKEAKELAEKALDETKTTVNEMLSRTEERMKLEKEQMLAEVKKDLVGLVIEATSKVAKKTMDEASNKKIVEETIKEMA